MSKVKKILSLSFMGLASVCVLSGSAFLFGTDKSNQTEISSADVSSQINNNVRDYFEAKWKKTAGTGTETEIKNLIATNSPVALFASTDSDFVNLRFTTEDIKIIEEPTGTKGPFHYNPDGDDSNDEWYAFNFDGFSIKHNDNALSVGETNASYITTQTAETDYYESFMTQAFDLDIKLNSTIENASVNGNTLTVKDEGVYEITIPYSLYYTNDNGNSFTSSSETLTYTFMIFKHSTYLQDSLNKPRVETAEFDIVNISNDSESVDTYYYHNYQSANLGYIKFDATKFDLTITKKYGFDSITEKIEFDSQAFENDNNYFVAKYQNSKIFKLSFDKSTKFCTVYFTDIGEYTLNFDLVYSHSNKKYVLPTSVKTQKAYLFGYQSTYTVYDSNTKQNSYPEFKSIDENFNVTKSADITSKVTGEDFSSTTLEGIINDEDLALTPVSTNQTPVKFNENANLSSATLYKVTRGGEALSLDGGTQINASKNISSAGTYLVVFEYSFNEYRDRNGLINASKRFHQVFYFNINNATPTVNVYASDSTPSGETPSLASGQYTNKNVYVESIYEENEFNSDVIIKIEKYDFEEKTTTTSDLSDYSKDGDYFVFTENGNYTIKIYFGRQGINGTPITRRFNIDKTDIKDVKGYSVESAGGSFYKTSSEITTLTNQPIIFSWQQEKQSGASVTGYYRYYPINKTTNLTSLSSNLSTYITNNLGIPVDYELNLSDVSWNYYENARGVENTSSISRSYIRESSGLYVLQVFDDAGNSAVKVFLVDKTSPNFVIKTTDSSNTDSYSFLTKNTTISEDAEIIWGENKIFKVNPSSTTGSLYQNKNDITDTKLKDALDAFKTDYFKTLNFFGSDTGLNGEYVNIKINKEILYSEKGSDFDFEEIYSKKIISSYSLYYTAVDGIFNYYFSTSNPEVYIKVDNPSAENAYENGTVIYKIDIVGELKEYVGNPDGNNYQSVYIMEGSFNFLLRDESNTMGSSLSDKEKYLQFPSAYQIVNLTSDASLLQVGYQDSESDIVPLISADSPAYEITISDDSPAYDGANEGQKIKYAYYQPTSLNKKLYISFLPRIENDGKVTQVESVNIKFYPYETKPLSYFDTSTGKIKFNYHRTLSQSPTIDYNIYEWKDDISTAQLTYELNIINNVTAEGKYVITRTYKLNGEGETQYSIDKYDYYQRVLTVYVDRENVISEPDVINAKVLTYQATIDEEEVTFKTAGSVLVSSAILDGANYYAKASLKNGKTVNTTDLSVSEYNSSYYYSFSDEISKISLFNSSGEIPLESPTIENENSTQSIVGNGILVSVFAGDSSSVEYPNYKDSQDGLTALNSGYTFYTTSQSYTGSSTPVTTNPVFTTNKIPFAINIPEFKYSLQAKKSDSEEFEISNDSSLSYFREGFELDYYKLSAKVYLEGKLIAQSDGAEKGFLTFKSTANNSPIQDFTEPGNYVVVVTQAENSISSSLNENSFRNCYTFSFIVESAVPEFTISADGKELEGTDNTLYTNNDEIEITWIDSDDPLKTNIDEKNILLNINNNNYTISINKSGNSVEILEDDSGLNLTAFKFKSVDLTNILTINLETLGIYELDQELNVTMKFKSPAGNNLYPDSSKKVVVDTTIYDISTNSNGDKTYTTTLDKLFENIANLDYSLSLNTLRQGFDSNGVITEILEKTSYSGTIQSGFYKYYSFPVNKSFFENLLEKTQLNKTSNLKGTTSVYYRQIDNIYSGDFTETSYSNFFPSNPDFKELTLSQNIEIGYYYEIIEKDYAGNLIIYLVSCFQDNGSKNGLGVTNPSLAVTNDEIKSNKYNIYGSTSLTFKEFSFLEDKWNFIRLDGNTRFVASPWLNGQVLNLSTGEIVDISNMLPKASLTKNVLEISDRSSNQFYKVYIARSNTSSLSVKNYSDSVEGISISIPSDDIVSGLQIKTFPVKVQIETSFGGEASVPYEPFVNDPNENLFTEGYNYQNAWNVSRQGYVAQFDPTTSTLNIFFTTNPAINTKIKYIITDNFGKETNVIHISGTSFTESIDKIGNVYESFDSEGNLYYRTQEAFAYNINPSVFRAEIYSNGVKIEVEEYLANNISYSTDSQRTRYEFFCGEKQIDKKFEIKVFDQETDDYVKSIYVHLYKMLPTLDGTEKIVRFIDENANDLKEDFSSTEQVVIDGVQYTARKATTFATIVNVYYDPSPTEIPYVAYIYKVGGEESFVPIDSGYKIQGSGTYYLMFKYNAGNIFTNEYVLYKLEILDSSTTFFFVTVDGNIVPAQSNYYTAPDGTQYSNYFIVNVPYSENSRVKLERNGYQQVKLVGNEPPIISQDVTTIIYHLSNKDGGSYPSNVSPYSDYVVISYVPRTLQPVKEILYISATGEQEFITNRDSVMVVSEKESNFNKLKIRWSKYYGIKQNLIAITAEKDGYNYSLPVYYEENHAYTELDISGTYKLTFMDASGNIQNFGSKSYLEVVFLKDVHFTMEYSDLEGNLIETEAIDKGIFNSELKLKLKNIGEYYTTSSVGIGENIITATRNGLPYEGYIYDKQTSAFIFKEVGYYQVYFSATALNETAVREQVYSFTIINKNESRYAFEYSDFANYYIEKVLFDNGVRVEDKTELKGSSLLVSYFNETPTSGLWTITINTNEKLTPGSDEPTRFTFSFLIRMAKPPINISVAEGSTTTDVINVSFNAENIYNAVGDCIITVGREKYAINESTIAEIGIKTISITNAGTYYIQVTTESGNLIYSYKVIKKDPLNGWAIAAIVISSVVAVVIVIIVIKLRKRIKVK